MSIVPWVGLGAALAGAVVGFVASLFAPVAYEARVVLAVGRVARVGALESAGRLVQRLRVLDRIGKKDGELPLLRVVTLLDEGDQASMMELQMVARSPEEAEKGLRKVVERVMAEHRDRFERLTDVHRRQLAALREWETFGADRRSGTRGAVETKDRWTPPRPSERSNDVLTSRDVAAVESAIANVRVDLMEPRTEPTRVIGEVVGPARRVGPKRVLMSAIGAAIGVLAAVALGLLRAESSRIRANA